MGYLEGGEGVKRAEPRPEKVAAVEHIRERLGRGQTVVLADYRGLDVKTTDELRRRLREAGVEFQVVKNTLALRAAREVGLDGLEAYLKGPTAMAYGTEDLVAPAKVLTDFIREFRRLEIKGGVVEGRVLTPEDVQKLAELPSREQLVAQVLAGMQGPVRGVVMALGGLLRSLVYTLDAVRRQREEGAGA